MTGVDEQIFGGVGIRALTDNKPYGGLLRNILNESRTPPSFSLSLYPKWREVALVGRLEA